MARSYLRPVLMISRCYWPAATVCYSPLATFTRPPAAPLCPQLIRTLAMVPASRTSQHRFQVTLPQLQPLSIFPPQLQLPAQQLQGSQLAQTRPLPNCQRPRTRMMPPLQHPAMPTLLPPLRKFPQPGSQSAPSLREIAGALTQRIPLISPNVERRRPRCRAVTESVSGFSGKSRPGRRVTGGPGPHRERSPPARGPALHAAPGGRVTDRAVRVTGHA